jgi:hypothetical protein
MLLDWNKSIRAQPESVDGTSTLRVSTVDGSDIYTDVQIEAINIATSINEIADIEGLKYYPNPVRSKLMIENSANGFATMSIINLQGKVIKSVDLNRGQNEVSLDDLSNGYYILQLSMDDEVYQGRILKQ